MTECDTRRRPPRRREGRGGAPGELKTCRGKPSGQLERGGRGSAAGRHRSSGKGGNGEHLPARRRGAVGVRVAVHVRTGVCLSEVVAGNRKIKASPWVFLGTKKKEI